MERFTLTKSAFPDTWQGYKLNTDFHGVLAILAALNDPELNSADRLMIVRRRLFADKAPTVTQIMPAFVWFESCGMERTGGEGGARDFDFEQDAREIYASFRQVYGIDLMRPLHWWAFSALLDGVTAAPCALRDKIQLRHMDDSRAQTDTALERAKRAAAITDAHSLTEKSRDDELRRRLAEGLPFDDLLREEGEA